MSVNQPQNIKLLDFSNSTDLLKIESDLGTIETWEKNKLGIEKLDSTQAYWLGQQHAINILNSLLAQNFAPEEVVKRLWNFTSNRDKFLVHVEDLTP